MHILRRFFARILWALLLIFVVLLVIGISKRKFDVRGYMGFLLDRPFAAAWQEQGISGIFWGSGIQSNEIDDIIGTGDVVSTGSIDTTGTIDESGFDPYGAEGDELLLGTGGISAETSGQEAGFVVVTGQVTTGETSIVSGTGKSDSTNKDVKNYIYNTSVPTTTTAETDLKKELLNLIKQQEK